MAGDHPLDMQSYIGDEIRDKMPTIVGQDMLDDKFYGLFHSYITHGAYPEDLRNARAILESDAEAIAKKFFEHDDIGWQVLAVMMMQLGCRIDAALKQRMIAAFHNDEWAGEGRCDERIEEMCRMEQAVREYDNIAVDHDKDPGLLAKVLDVAEDAAED